VLPQGVYGLIMALVVVVLRSRNIILVTYSFGVVLEHRPEKAVHNDILLVLRAGPCGDLT
jgi:hypothetical protein